MGPLSGGDRAQGDAWQLVIVVPCARDGLPVPPPRPLTPSVQGALTGHSPQTRQGARGPARVSVRFSSSDANVLGVEVSGELVPSCRASLPDALAAGA